MAENLTTVHFKSDATHFTKVWNTFQLLSVETRAITIYLSLPLNSGMNPKRVLIRCLTNLRITEWWDIREHFRENGVSQTASLQDRLYIEHFHATSFSVPWPLHHVCWWCRLHNYTFICMGVDRMRRRKMRSYLGKAKNENNYGTAVKLFYNAAYFKGFDVCTTYGPSCYWITTSNMYNGK